MRTALLEQLEPRLVLTAMVDWADLADGYPFALFTDETLETAGLVGSYVNQSLRAVDESDWRETQDIAGARVDFPLLFGSDGWGARSQVGLSGGTDNDWDNFSVQWDGVLDIRCDGLRLATRSDDGSRMWIDRNGDGVFSEIDGEMVDNGWGTSHPLHVGEESSWLATGAYEIRIQFENDAGPNLFHLADDPTVRLAERDTFRLFVDEARATPGLTGSYVSQSLWSVDELDWRESQTIAGSRIDPAVNFNTTNWGRRAEVGLTSGTDANWDYFSVQWDGFLEILADGTSVRTRSDDGSRMWIDVNRDGIFDSAAGELTVNGWGYSQSANNGPPSHSLEAGVYSIRIQYYDWNTENVIQLLDVPPDMVRVAYVVPSNRTPQPRSEARLAYTVMQYQAWYRDQMERNGFGSKSFVYELYADGVTPVVHTVYVDEEDSYLRGDIWGRVLTAASHAGVSTWSSGEAWLLVPEIHLQQADGSIIGGVALGGSWGSAGDGGVAMIGSNALPFMDPVSLADDRSYDGLILPELGPYPLERDVSFAGFEGSTISSVASSLVGAALHELSHAFGLGHDFRNDANFHGNLMGNGLRGFRNEVYPDQYPQDETRLAYAASLALSASTYFNGRQAADTSRPVVSMSTSGSVVPVGGLLEITFSASDPEGLAGVLLSRNGDVVGELVLSGTSVSDIIATPLYSPGTSENFVISVYDIHGNRTDATAYITVRYGFNQAPHPFFKVVPSTVAAGGTVLLDASGTTDADEASATLLVEWDLDGDGVFDTAPSTEKRLSIPQAAVGDWLVRCRVTDSRGAFSVSTPIALRVYEPVSSPAYIVGRHIFYNRSAWDGNNAAADISDDAAIASDKTALLPGQPATFANYTSYDKGINGVMIDVRDLAGTPTVNDFLFRAGVTRDPYGTDLNDPADDWPWAPAPTSITVRAGAGLDGADRVTLIWADGAIKKCWLQVTMRATDTTGLAANDVFYVGNAVGESGNAASDALVNATDEIGARNNPHSPFLPASRDDRYDYNRDKLVNATDQIIARNNRTSPFTALKLITPPLEPVGGEGEAGDWRPEAGEVVALLLNASELPHKTPEPRSTSYQRPESRLSSEAGVWRPEAGDVALLNPSGLPQTPRQPDVPSSQRPESLLGSKAGDELGAHDLALTEFLNEWEQL